jgi:hypothetical protein
MYALRLVSQREPIAPAIVAQAVASGTVPEYLK